MDVLKQFLDKNLAKPEVKVGIRGADGISDKLFSDKLLEMKLTRERLGLIAALAVSGGVLFYVWGRPKLKKRVQEKKTKGILKKTKGSQTEMTSTSICMSGCTPSISFSVPQASGEAQACCGQDSGQQTEATVDVQEASARTVDVQALRRPYAVLASWTTKSGPSYSVNFSRSNEDRNARKKRVSFSKSVVEPSGDNDAYRRNPRSAARLAGKGTRPNEAGDNKKNGDVSRNCDENCTNHSGVPTQPCHPDTIRNFTECGPQQTEPEPEPGNEEQVAGTQKGCRHTRTADSTVQRFYPLRSHDRNQLVSEKSYRHDLQSDRQFSDNHRPTFGRVIPKNSICDQGQECCKYTGSSTCTSTVF